MSFIRNHYFTFLLYGFICFSQVAYSQEEITVTVSDEIDIAFEIFKPLNEKSSEYLMLWLAPEYGFRPGHRIMAQLLTKQNIEVWQTDIVESLFMPRGSGSIRKLNGKYTADTIEYAHKTTGKKIIIAGDSYAAINALIGAHQWQNRKHDSTHLIGAMLFTPSSYASVPPLGLDPVFMPIMDATNIPLIIYQTKNSRNINQFKTVLEKLQQHNNPVYVKMIPEVMSLFYSEQPVDAINKQRRALAPNIKKMLAVLDKHNIPARPLPLTKNSSTDSGIDIYLKKYKGTNQPLSIKLLDAHDRPFVKNDFTGKVTVINFWATWCPPCVEEIPSLNRLNKKMRGKPFDLISVNYAEDKQTILKFLKKVDVDYPVLLDNDGEFAKKWNVITYPSTFIIDTHGNIIYGVNAAIVWDDPAFIKKIQALF